ncbi:LytR/AlgR family response regulator transcription factor [Flagellimonas meridianipacifica]|uniref:DNA-binding LytR/AlgR family response regulator n=1 Tax=Flagellimonas meridianipacifica TaxID=1080225 RepID=A0A2T0MAK7_9FLAO|nr:LytTR family DNA-binding domain-containing protein [Allomuricauda pacifica]PRX54442.1 DNA-binding LytR/AlgR family response regulator [Allomuricauda pacifica]
MITYAIVDDEPIAHRIIEGYCVELTHLHKIGNAYNVFEASEIISKHQVDLIFLDINMPKMTGFEWLKMLTKPPKIIVTSAYKEFALEGYQLNIVDYLLKPFSFARFLKAVNKASIVNLDNGFKSVAISDNVKDNRLFLKGDKMYHQVQIDQILFVEAYGNYSKVCFEENSLVTHEKISGLENILPREQFLRVHKSFLVAKDKIEIIQGNQIVIGKYKIPIGQTFKAKVNSLLNK